MRDLLELIVSRLGHEAVLSNLGAPPADEIDLLLVEPTSRRALDLTCALLDERPDLPVVALSVFPRAQEWKQIELCSYVLKPFTVAQIELVIGQCLNGC